MAEEKYAILSENSDMVLCESVLEERRGNQMTMEIVDDVGALNGLKSVKFHKMQSYAEVYQGQIRDIKGNIVLLGDVVNISAQMRTEIKIKTHVGADLQKQI